MYPTAWFSLKLGMWEDKLTLHASITVRSKIREAYDTRGNTVSTTSLISHMDQEKNSNPQSQPDHDHLQVLSPAPAPPSPTPTQNIGRILPSNIVSAFSSRQPDSTVSHCLLPPSLSVAIFSQSPIPVLSSSTSIVSPASDWLSPFLLPQYRWEMGWCRKGWGHLRPQGELQWLNVFP